MTTEKLKRRKYSELTAHLTDKMKEAGKKDQSAGLLCVSIDNLPMIISSHGDEEAEVVVDELVSVLSRAVSLDKDVVVRTEQDRIHVILMNYSPQQMREKGLELRKEIQNYGCKHAVKPIQIMSTIGSVNFAEAENAIDAMNKAYIAVNEAKERFRQYVEYGDHEKHERESRNQMILATYLQNAMLKNRLSLAFQPIINSRTGDVGYYECLLRIVNEDGTVSSAGPFIPIAEKMGFIDVVDGLVLQLAVTELHNNPDVRLAINLSNSSLNDSNWLEMAISMLDDPALASRLIVEITETSEAQSYRRVLNFVTTLQGLGCEIALDDFGAGYTSFSQLKTLPVDIIKIDGSFVKGIAENNENKFFVKTLLDFSNSFGLKTVAEFVENGETAKVLMDMNVDYMQGNYFSPAVNYREWVADRQD